MKNFYRKNVDTYHKKNVQNNIILDSQTRKDLSLDSFYEIFNKTKTSYGDQLFYHKINSQNKNIEEIKKMKIDLEFLSKNNVIKSLLEKNLEKIGKQKRGNVINDLWDGLNYTPKYINLIPYWVFLAPISLILLFIIWGGLALWGVFVLIIVNLIIFKITNININSAAGSMNYLIKTLAASSKIKRNKNFSFFNNFLVYNKKLNRIRKYNIFLQDVLGTSIIGDELASAVLDYLRIFLCAELFAYYKIFKYITKYQQDVKNIIDDIGYLDLIINSSNIIKDNETSYPLFQENNGIIFDNLTHPLVNNCKPYKFDVTQSIIITGMNMAGKSTFMKSVAINQILAMSFGFTFSRKFITSNYIVITSMKIEDDLEKNKSKYYMEAERLLLIQNLLKQNKLLCLIDEILTGTNTIDRIDASIGILKNFIRYNKSIIFAATHDKDIAENLFPEYSNYYFDGELGNKEIIYDYKIKKGIVSRRNAFQLLEDIGLELIKKSI